MASFMNITAPYFFCFCLLLVLYGYPHPSSRVSISGRNTKPVLEKNNNLLYFFFYEHCVRPVLCYCLLFCPNSFDFHLCIFHILVILTSVPSSSPTLTDLAICFTANPYPIPPIRAKSIQNIYILQTLSHSQ